MLQRACAKPSSLCPGLTFVALAAFPGVVLLAGNMPPVWSCLTVFTFFPITMHLLHIRASIGDHHRDLLLIAGERRTERRTPHAPAAPE